MENYTTIMRRIGAFSETAQIKVHTNEEILNELIVCFTFSVLFALIILLPFNLHYFKFKQKNYLQSLHQKYPQITYLYEIGKSVQGRPLTVLAIGKFPMRHVPGIPEFKYVANIHGNEVCVLILKIFIRLRFKQ